MVRGGTLGSTGLLPVALFLDRDLVVMATLVEKVTLVDRKRTS